MVLLRYKQQYEHHAFQFVISHLGIKSHLDSKLFIIPYDLPTSPRYVSIIRQLPLASYFPL